MCLFFPPPKKRRYPSSALEDPRPRKRRVTYQQLEPLPTRSSHAHVRYEPLRGHGVKRDPPSASAANGGALRGHGARRDPSKQPSDVRVRFARPVEFSQPAQPQRHAHAHVRQRRPSTKSSSDYRRKEREHRHHAAQYRSSLTAARENPLSMSQTRQPPGYDYSVPASYYLDLCAVREATNHALQATIYEPQAPQRDSRHLRRQPAYSTLRYNY